MKTHEKTKEKSKGISKSGALADDPDLQELLAAWRSLTAVDRRSILGIIRRVADAPPAVARVAPAAREAEK